MISSRLTSIMLYKYNGTNEEKGDYSDCFGFCYPWEMFPKDIKRETLHFTLFTIESTAK